MSDYPKDCPDSCPYCGSAREVPGFSETLEAHPQRFDCGSQWGPTKVYRAPGCYEIREGKLEAALERIAEENPPAEEYPGYESLVTSDNTGDVFEAGVLCGAAEAGKIAREALETPR